MIDLDRYRYRFRYTAPSKLAVQQSLANFLPCKASLSQCAAATGGGKIKMDSFPLAIFPPGTKLRSHRCELKTQ